MNWLKKLFGKHAPAMAMPLSTKDIESYAAFTFLRTQSIRSDARERVEGAIAEIKSLYPGRVIDQQGLNTIEISSSVVRAEVSFFIKKGESPADFAQIIDKTFKKYWL